ncbi:aminotransferase class V-fold PLP-dependent enzyme [Calditrichota bacterium LG25]
MFHDYRKLFPITSQKIYLNHAAISPFSTRVTERLEWYLDERQFGTIDVFKKADELRSKTRNLLAGLINARPENIAFITNTSEGFNHLVNGLEWQAGDEVLVPDCEFPSNMYPFLNLERKGVIVKKISSPDGLVDLEKIKAAITSKTRLLSISFVEFSSGFRNDLQAIGQLCKEQGILFSVDGIQGVGAMPLDVQACHIDFLSNGGHKWLMGAMGAGFMYIAPELFSRLKPAFTGWLAVENAWDFFDYRLDFLPDARRFEYGTSNFIGITALSASVELLMEANPDKIQEHLFKLGEILVEELEKMGLRFVNTKDRHHWSGIYSFKAARAEKLFEEFEKHQVVVSLRNGLIRLAPHFYNNEQEIEQVIKIIKKFYK